MRVFLDTNVLISAFATRGLCADLLRYVLAEHELLVGEVVLTELRRILRERIGVPDPVVAEIEELLGSQTVIPAPSRHLELGLPDPDDEWIVASARAAEADALITGDNDILGEKGRIPVPVYSPREFWDSEARKGS
ncbi:MAG: putative toxin-antitoxin system toxin component, PIN family [Thermoleophilia bacterium]